MPRGRSGRRRARCRGRRSRWDDTGQVLDDLGRWLYTTHTDHLPASALDDGPAVVVNTSGPSAGGYAARTRTGSVLEPVNHRRLRSPDRREVLRLSIGHKASENHWIGGPSEQRPRCLARHVPLDLVMVHRRRRSATSQAPTTTAATRAVSRSTSSSWPDASGSRPSEPPTDDR
jgi:hypothetical protein